MERWNSVSPWAGVEGAALAVLGAVGALGADGADGLDSGLDGELGLGDVGALGALGAPGIPGRPGLPGGTGGASAGRDEGGVGEVGDWTGSRPGKFDGGGSGADSGGGEAGTVSGDSIGSRSYELELSGSATSPSCGVRGGAFGGSLLSGPTVFGIGCWGAFRGAFGPNHKASASDGFGISGSTAGLPEMREPASETMPINSARIRSTNSRIAESLMSSGIFLLLSTFWIA